MDERKETNQGKAIKTDFLMIRDNIMEWGNTMIQLSNVSSISTITFIHKIPFPVLALILLLGGLLYIQMSAAVGILVAAAGGVWLFYWWSKNNNPDKTETLNIMMNSGTVFEFVFENESFKMRVLKVLEAIIAEGGKKTIGDINIDFHNSRIQGDLSFMNGRKW